MSFFDECDFIPLVNSSTDSLYKRFPSVKLFNILWCYGNVDLEMKELCIATGDSIAYLEGPDSIRVQFCFFGYKEIDLCFMIDLEVVHLKGSALPSLI